MIKTYGRNTGPENEKTGPEMKTSPDFLSSELGTRSVGSEKPSSCCANGNLWSKLAALNTDEMKSDFLSELSSVGGENRSNIPRRSHSKEDSHDVSRQTNFQHSDNSQQEGQTIHVERQTIHVARQNDEKQIIHTPPLANQAVDERGSKTTTLNPGSSSESPGHNDLEQRSFPKNTIVSDLESWFRLHENHQSAKNPNVNANQMNTNRVNASHCAIAEPNRVGQMNCLPKQSSACSSAINSSTASSTTLPIFSSTNNSTATNSTTVDRLSGVSQLSFVD